MGDFDQISKAMNAKPHHIGYVVKNLEDGVATFVGSLAFRRRTRPLYIPGQSITVCFVELSESFYIELISPDVNNAKLSRYMGVGFYHISFLVDDLQKSHDRLCAEQFISLPKFESEAFLGGWCQFFLTPQNHLIELIQIPEKGFEDFFNHNLEVDT